MTQGQENENENKAEEKKPELTLTYELIEGDLRFHPVEKSGAWGLCFKDDGSFIGLRRKDGKYFVVLMMDMGTYGQPVLWEEPKTKADETTGLRVVGKVGIYYSTDGKVLVSDTKTVDGQTDVELVPVSNSSLQDVKGEPSGYYRANLKRVSGDIQVLVTEAPQAYGSNHGLRWMPIREFIEKSMDGRGLAALTKAQLNPEFRAVYLKAMAG